jgi:hypothetical protein
MGPLRALSERALLRWRTWRGRGAAAMHLDLLAAEMRARGYRCVALYRAGELPVRPLLLWVFALGPERQVRVAVGVRPRGDTWCYHLAGYGCESLLGDARRAAERVDALLRGRMFPAAR